MRVSISEARDRRQLQYRLEVPCELTWPMNTKRVTAKAEDLAAHGVDGRLRQALELANVLAELVDNFLDMP